MDPSALLRKLSSLGEAAYKHQLAKPTYPDLLYSRPFLDFSYSLCEARSNKEFIRFLARSPRIVGSLSFGKTTLINSVIFKHLLSYTLDSIVNDYCHLECFSEWDHYLFSSHIQLEDSPGWFRSAFWDINSHTHNFASKFVRPDLVRSDSSYSDGPIVFVFKGPAALAHYENFNKYLASACKIFSPDLFRVIFLDIPPSKVPVLPCKVFSLGEKNPLDKLNAYCAILARTSARSSVWIASVQNLGLYMFSRFCAKQAYWSMKYHSIYSTNIDLNLRTSTLSLPSNIDGLTWYGMPTDLSSLVSFNHNHNSLDFRTRLQQWVSGDDLPGVVTLGREIKINNPAFVGLIESLLPKFRFSYSGRRPASAFDSMVDSDPLAVNYLGWLDRSSMDHAISSSIVYLDSFPFGGGHTCFYALALKRPILMLDTDQNRRCSFMMHLIDLLEALGLCDCDYRDYGIFQNPGQIVSLLHSLSVRKSEALHRIIQIQENQYSVFRQFMLCTDYEKQIIQSVGYF